MTSTAPRHRYSYRDYLAVEEAGIIKHEFFDGEIYAMAGGTPEHAALSVAVSSALQVRLRGGPCRIYSSDLRVRILTTGLSTYPDVTVVCGPIERDPESPQTVVNPTVVVEVTSEGTEAYDRSEKLEHYRAAPSLQECVLVSHRERAIEVWRRDKNRAWSHQRFGRGAKARIESVACELELDAIYLDALGEAAP